MRKALLPLLVLSIAVLTVWGSQQASEELETEDVAIAKAEPPKVEKKDPKLQYVDTDTGRWLIHDMKRPRPKIITPDEPGKPFKDVIVLFGGDDPNLSGWVDSKGKPSKWIIKDGVMESVKKSGYIKTKQKFGSCQLHVEFRTPVPVKGSGQGRGNSGVFLMDEYEVQVLDSFENRTYADGMCGALYGREVPDVDVNLWPGTWQSFDIIFFRPIFKDGKVVRKARFTVFQNGILIHYDKHLQGGTQWKGPHKISDYNTTLPDEGPLALQDHGNPVQFRNIWIRRLED
ncbi:MAG: 3-keto-disaccharide hydrolase [Planctomycetota bacterium]|jgi:hypothetical protein